MAEYPRVPDPPAPDPAQARIVELRKHLAECVGALRTAQPHVAMRPVRLGLEAVALRAEQALVQAGEES